MSDAMMPISADALHHRTLLFELSKPVVVSVKKFNEVWPYVDSVYTKIQQELLQKNGTIRVQKYECRLRKSSKPGTARVAVEGKIIKRRNSSIRDKDLCHVRIKVSRPVDGTAVVIERLDDHTHTHDIEESFQIRKPSILLGYIKSEVAKNYSPAQIYHALRGAGTHEGSKRLAELGGSSLKRSVLAPAHLIFLCLSLCLACNVSGLCCVCLIQLTDLEYRQDIVNLKRGMKSADVQALPHGILFQDDILHARSLLTAREWLVEELQIVDNKNEQRWGMVFAHPTRLLTLQRRGWFTQFDATHKLNRWGHNMFSFLVRNEHNVWIPTAHLVVERENGEIIAEGLGQIKQWCSGMSDFQFPSSI